MFKSNTILRLKQDANQNNLIVVASLGMGFEKALYFGQKLLMIYSNIRYTSYDK